MVRNRTAWALVAILGLAMASGARLEAQGPNEGIQVRGHWVFEVRDPDGTFVSRKEFDNALTPTGAGRLAEFLAGVNVPGRWMIVVDNPNNAANPFPVAPFESGPSGGWIVDASSGLSDGSRVFKTLVRRADGVLMLTGSATALQSGTVTTVATKVGSCSRLQDPCPEPPPSSPETFTSTAVNQPLEGGQILQVTVTISFSSAPHPPSF